MEALSRFRGPELYIPPAAVPARQRQKGYDSPFLHMHLLYRIGIIAVYALILLTIVLNVEISSRSPVFILLCIALVLNFAVVLLPIIFYKPSYGWFHPLVFNACMYLLFQFRSYATYWGGLSHHKALPTWSPEEILTLVVYAIALKSIATASYFFGFFFGPSFKVPRLSFPVPNRVGLKAVVVVLVTLVVFYLYISGKGGLAAHLLSWQEGRHDAMAGDGYWHLAIKFAAAATLLWFTLDRRAAYKPVFWLCAFVSILINFFATGSRSLAVFFVIAGFLVWMLREKKVAPGRILIITFVVVSAVGLLGSYRQQIWRGETSLASTAQDSSVLDSFIEGAVESGERSWSGNGLLPIIALVPHDVDFLYGSSYVSVLTLPIPRKLWEDKPGQIGGLVGETFFRSPAGTPPGAIGEAYWNFHIPGVVLIFFIWGAFHKWLKDVYLAYAGKPAMILIYLNIMFTFDPTTPALVAGMLQLMPALVLFWLIGALRFGRS
ncbi:MAG TPA: O-antigen polymerase [Pyrinomonadaceae bacterium]|nr:O-antigen polymerase [Pyrinomonadaceae bacterium]